MEDVSTAKEKQRPTNQTEGPRRKYMDQLQEVADRKRDEILVELDDLDNVSWTQFLASRDSLTGPIVREKPWRGYGVETRRIG